MNDAHNTSDEMDYAPRTSMARSSAGTLSRKEAICFLSETSSGRVTNLPPSFRPDSLCAAAHASATVLSASTRRAARMRFEPPYVCARMQLVRGTVRRRKLVWIIVPSRRGQQWPVKINSGISAGLRSGQRKLDIPRQCPRSRR